MPAARSAAASGFLEAKRKHFLTAGIPYELLPRVGGIAYDGRVPDENVLLTHNGGGAAKEIPLASAGKIGKGRWVCFAWDVYSNLLTGEGYSFSRITPQAENETDWRTRKPGVMTDRAGRRITWRYWEYFFSLAGRALLWAARREPDLAAEVAGRDPGGLAVTVQCPDRPRRVVLEMTCRNKFSEDVASQSRTVDLVKGKNTFHFTPPANLMPGVTLADLRVLTPAGKVVTWASGYYQTRPPLEIAAVELERAILPPGAEPVVRGRVRLSGQPGPDHALEVAITDFHGRLVFRQTLAATATAFEARPLDALSVPMTLEVRLRQGPRLLDKHSQTVLLLKPRTWDPLAVLSIRMVLFRRPRLADPVSIRPRQAAGGPDRHHEHDGQPAVRRVGRGGLRFHFAAVHLGHERPQVPREEQRLCQDEGPQVPGPRAVPVGPGLSGAGEAV